MHRTLILFTLLLIAGCQSGDTSNPDNTGLNKDFHEQVVDRYPDGSKRVLAIYEGKGSDEQILRRITYAKNGVRVRVEDVRSGKIKQYEDLYEDQSDSDYLQSFLEGSVWLRSSGEGATRISAMYLFDSKRGLQAVETNESETCDSYDISYSGYRAFIVPTSESDSDTLEVKFSSPNKIFLGSPSIDIIPLERVDKSTIQSDFLINCINEFYSK
jgi:hypothetical protein